MGYLPDIPLPSSQDAERSILGGILLDNEHFYDDAADLRVDEFSLDSHRKIYAAMNEILGGVVEGVSNVDIVTLVEVLRRRKQLDAIGGAAYLASLTEGLPRRLSLDEYVHIVKEKARLRSLVRICDATLKQAFDQSESAIKITAALQDRLVGEAAESESEPVRIGSATRAVEERIQRMRRISSTSAAAEMTWGIAELDAQTKGAFFGELTVVAGESGGYKTALATQALLANARQGVSCAVFSIEMSLDQLCARMYPQMGNIITANMMRDPRLINEHTHIPEIRRLSAELDRLPIYVDDSPQHINRLIARMRMLRRKCDVKLFVIDYLQLIEPNPARTEAEGVKANIFALRDFQKSEPGCHTILLSQFAKSGGMRGKKVTRTRDDLYGSSAVHHAAQNVFLIKVESAKGKPTNQLLEAEIDIDKQRNGIVAKVQTMLDRDWLRFTQPEPILTT